jgi:hypothetical protein
LAAFFFPPDFAAFFFVAMVSHLLPEVVSTTTDVLILEYREPS